MHDISSPTVATGELPVYAVIAAAGSGQRLGFGQPKAFVGLGGRSLLERALDGIADSGAVDAAIVMVGPEMRPVAEEMIAHAANKFAWSNLRVEVATGGDERADSVYAGLENIERELGSSVDCVQLAAISEAIVLVHDAARCLTPPGMIARIVDEVRRGAQTGEATGVVPALPVTDTIKVVEGDFITSTPARQSLRAVQTPQGFLFSSLLDANRKHQASVELGHGYSADATDDASIMELAGYPVKVIDGDAKAMKVTTRRDYAIAELMVGSGHDDDKDF